MKFFELKRYFKMSQESRQSTPDVFVCNFRVLPEATVDLIQCGIVFYWIIAVDIHRNLFELLSRHLPLTLAGLGGDKTPL